MQLFFFVVLNQVNVCFYRMSERGGSIEIVSDDVIEWVVPCPYRKGDGFRSPKFYFDAYKAGLCVCHRDNDFVLYVDIEDPDLVLRLSCLTIALVCGQRVKRVFSDKVEDYPEEFLSCEVEIPKKDIERFEFHNDSASMLRFRFSFEMDERFRRLPKVIHPLHGSMASFFGCQELSDGTLVIF